MTGWHFCNVAFLATVATGRVLQPRRGLTQHFSLSMVSNFITPSTCTNTSARRDPVGFTQQTSLTPPEHFRGRDVHKSARERVHRLILRWFNVLSVIGVNGTDGDGI